MLAGFVHLIVKPTQKVEGPFKPYPPQSVIPLTAGLTASHDLRALLSRPVVRVRAGTRVFGLAPLHREVIFSNFSS